MARRVWVPSSLKQIMRIERVGFQIYRVLFCKGIPILIDSCDSKHSNLFSLIFYVLFAEGIIPEKNTIIRLVVFQESAAGLEAYARDLPFTLTLNLTSSCHQLKRGKKFKLWKPEENGKKGCYVNVKCLNFERWACNFCLLFIPSSSHHHINLLSLIHIHLIPWSQFFLLVYRLRIFPRLS